jgi:hypothetical protein
MNKILASLFVVAFCVGYTFAGGLKSASGIVQNLISSISINVGTNIDAPGATLHVSSDTQSSVRLTNNSTGRTSTDGLDLFIGASDSGIRVFDARNFIIYTSNAEMFRIGSGGGITLSTVMQLYSRTSAQLQALTNGGAGTLVYNSTTGTMCMSTNTTAGAWVILGSTTTACD